MNTESKIRGLLKRESFLEVYSDVNLEYGGLFVRENERGQSYSVVEIIDLDSANGADGQMLVCAYEVAYSCYSHKERQAAMEYAGLSSVLGELARDGKRELARCMLVSDMCQYGLHDSAGYGASWFIAVLDRTTEKIASERWLENRVRGWGWAAVLRAVENAIAACNSAFRLPNELENE